MNFFKKIFSKKYMFSLIFALFFLVKQTYAFFWIPIMIGGSLLAGFSGTGGSVGDLMTFLSGDAFNSLFGNILNAVGGFIIYLLFQIFYIVGTIFVEFSLIISFFFSIMMDLFFMNIPTINSIKDVILGDTNNNASLDALNSVYYFSSYIILIISIIAWLFLGGFTFLKKTIQSFSNSDNEDGKNFLFGTMFRLVIGFVLVFSLPIFLPKVFDIGSTISKLTYNIGINAVKVDEGNFPIKLENGKLVDYKSYEKLLSKYPMTLNLLSGIGISGKNGLLVLDGIENGNTNSKDLGTRISNGIGNFKTVVEKSIINKIQLDSNNINKAKESNDMSSFLESYLATQMVSFLNLILFVIIVSMIFTIHLKLFILFLTRFAGVIISTVFLPLFFVFGMINLTEKLGMRAIVSYIGNVLITPIAFAIMGIAVLITSTVTNYILNNANALGSEQNLLYLYLLLIAIYYGILTHLYQSIQNVGINLENILLSYSGNSGYDSTSDVMNASAKSFQMMNQYGGLRGIQSVIGVASQAKGLLGGMGTNKEAPPVKDTSGGVGGGGGGSIPNDL